MKIVSRLLLLVTVMFPAQIAMLLAETMLKKYVVNVLPVMSTLSLRAIALCLGVICVIVGIIILSRLVGKDLDKMPTRLLLVLFSFLMGLGMGWLWYAIKISI